MNPITSEKAGSSDVGTLKEYVSVIPEHLVRRFISADQDAVVVSGRVPDLDSSEILPVVDKLDAALNKVRAEHPGYEIAVTGLRNLAYSRGLTMPASSLGKIKMASQVTAILLLILGWERVPMLVVAGQAVMWLVLITALVSAVDYYQGFQRAMISRDEKIADFEAAKSAREKKIS